MGAIVARARAQLGRRWQDTELAAVYTSDLRRAVQTAEIAFADRSVPLISREFVLLAARIVGAGTPPSDTRRRSGSTRRVTAGALLPKAEAVAKLLSLDSPGL